MLSPLFSLSLFHFVLTHLLPLTLAWINHSSDTGWGKFDHFLFQAPLGPSGMCVCMCAVPGQSLSF